MRMKNRTRLKKRKMLRKDPLLVVMTTRRNSLSATSLSQLLNQASVVLSASSARSLTSSFLRPPMADLRVSPLLNSHQTKKLRRHAMA